MQRCLAFSAVKQFSPRLFPTEYRHSYLHVYYLLHTYTYTLNTFFIDDLQHVDRHNELICQSVRLPRSVCFCVMQIDKNFCFCSFTRVVSLFVHSVVEGVSCFVCQSIIQPLIISEYMFIIYFLNNCGRGSMFCYLVSAATTISVETFRVKLFSIIDIFLFFLLVFRSQFSKLRKSTAIQKLLRRKC